MALHFERSEFKNGVKIVIAALERENLDSLLMFKTEPERQAIISSVAFTAATLSTPSMLDGGKFTFPQEAYVAIAWPSDDVG